MSDRSVLFWPIVSGVLLSMTTICTTRIGTHRRVPWRWVLAILLAQWEAEFADMPQKWLFWFLVYVAIWWWVILFKDPDEPFRRLKKKTTTAMTQIQQLVLRRQQVEAFR